MRIVYNSLLPIKGFVAINLLGVIFARKEYKPLSNRTINHESIHTAQMKEWLYIGFYILYLIEWIFKGYKNISFEREAYTADHISHYLDIRRPYENYRS